MSTAVPFANIAHGCNSVEATTTAMKLSDYVVTEAGFGADLGAQKFLDIKCRLADLKPDACVIVATVRALKHHGGVAKADLNQENLEALKKGLPNLLKHVENITRVYGLPAVVAINKFYTDTDAELNMIAEACKNMASMWRFPMYGAAAAKAEKSWPPKCCASSRKSRITSVFRMRMI